MENNNQQQNVVTQTSRFAMISGQRIFPVGNTIC